MSKINNKGFSMVEVMVSMGLVIAIGGGLVALNSQHRKADQGIKNAGSLAKALTQLRNVVIDPEACNINLIGKHVPGENGLTLFKNASGTPVIKVGEKIENGAYELSDIDLVSHDTDSMRTQVRFSFKNNSDNVRSKTISRSFYVFTKMSGGKVSECLDPLKTTAESAKMKVCMDLDPEKQGDCNNVFRNLVHEVKSLYCKNHPYLGYDEYTGKCRPLDADKSCGSLFVRAYNADGHFECYPGPVRVDPPPHKPGAPTPPTPTPSVCSSWSAWAPLPSSVCFGNPLTQSRSCTDGAVTDSQIQPATGTDTSPSCCNDWKPSLDEVCTTDTIVQTNNCGQTRSVVGTKTCSSKDCKWSSPAAWGFTPAGPSRPHFECVEYFMPAGPSFPGFPSITIPDGETHSMNASYCVTTTAGSCHGTQTIKCTNGKISVVTASCNWGVIP